MEILRVENLTKVYGKEEDLTLPKSKIKLKDF